MASNALRRGSYAGGVLLCLLFGWIAFVRGAPVPLLSLVDLGFHELGHLLTYPFPDVVTAMTGSVTQVAVPVGLALYFLLLRRDQLGGGLCLAWAATSARDVSVYVADARNQTLPLLGDGIHDWGFLLGRFHALQSAGAIAAGVKILGLVLLFTGFALCAGAFLPRSPAWEAGRSSVPRRPLTGRVVDSLRPHGSLPYAVVITELSWPKRKAIGSRKSVGS